MARRRVACDAIPSKRFGRDARIVALATLATVNRGHRNEVRSRDLEAAGRDQGRAGPDLHADVLRRALRRACRRGRRRSRTACSTSTSTAAWSSSRRDAEWSDVAGGSARSSSIACAISSRRSTRRRTTAGSRRSRSTSTASPAAAQTAIGDLADAVRRVRAAGKPVVAYGAGYTDDSYQLAAAASEIWLNPLGAVLIAGPGGSNLYYKGLLDKLGVTANVYRVGTYKSAVEPFIRNDMSPEAKQNYMALDQAELETWRQERQAGAAQGERRPVPDQDMNGAVAAAGGDMAKAALGAGLVDQIGDRRAFEARLAELGGERRAASRAATSRIKLGVLRRRQGRPEADRADRRRDHRRHDRRRQGGAGHRRRRHDRQGRSRTASATRASRRWSCGSTAPAARCSPPSASARRCSTPRRRRSRSSCRWAASPRRAAIGSRRRPTSSTPSPRRSPDRSACSASCRASRERCRSSASAPTA